LKNTFILALAALTAFTTSLTSCTHSNNTGSGTIVRYSPQASTPLISTSKLDSAHTLFAKNGIAAANLQPFSLFPSDPAYLSSIRGVNGQAYSGIYYTVFCNQFLNGLILFNSTPNLYFDSTGALLPESTLGYTGPNPGTDTAGRQSLAHLRQLYLSTIRKDTAAYHFPNLPVNFYADTALQATLGYADAATIPKSGITTYNTALLKVWLINSVSGYSPDMLVSDSTGKVLEP